VAGAAVRIGVIGAGHWGPNQVRVFDSLPGSEVQVVADTDQARLDRVSDSFPDVALHTDHRQVLESADVDAVVIVTPTSTHHALVNEALAAGKHVLCEKPLCETPEQADELLAAAEANGCLLMVGHVFLFNPGIVKLKEVLDSGELGSLQYLSAVRTNLGPIRGDVNAAYDLAPHDISIFNWLVGSAPTSVSATGGSFVQPGIEDVVFISLRYPGDVLGSIHVSWLNPKKVREITVVGTRQMVTWDELQPRPVAIYDKGANPVQDYEDFGEFQRLGMWDRDVYLPKVPADEPLRLQGVEFLEAIRRGSVERSDGSFGSEVVRVLDAVRLSVEQGGAPVQVGTSQASVAR
jgi:predicted dehydrogenase